MHQIVEDQVLMITTGKLNFELTLMYLLAWMNTESTETTSMDVRGMINSESHFVKNIYLKKYNCCPYLVAHISINISI